ncbi:MAG: gamma-glutamyltransferase, partial [Pygmaiobacter sp.]
MANKSFLGKEVSEIAMYRPFVSGSRGGVSSNSPYASRAGLEMLRNGGNAIDAAVAISLVLGVVEPYHCGIGGGCFHVVYHKETNQFYAVDARGVAPLGADQDMF